MTYDAAYSYLLNLPRFATQGSASVQWGFARMEALMDAMGQPHQQFKSVHIAGTNGKGSTASMLASVASACGYRVGLHTSPHIWYVGERMRVDGRAASKAWLAEAVQRHQAVFERVKPSFFEATVALSFLFFAEQKVDYAVIEVGLGGRLDATNIIQPVLTAITSISLDHTALLGETHVAIAREKAGIVKPNTPLLTATEQAEVNAVFHEVTQAQHAAWHRVNADVKTTVVETYLGHMVLNVETPLRRYSDLHVDLSGAHQQSNAALAIRAAELLFPEVHANAEPVYRGLREIKQRTGMVGRLDVLQEKPLVLGDVAHNVESLAATLAFAEAEAQKQGGRLIVAFGAMQDKALGAMVELFNGRVAHVWPVALEGERAMPINELRGLLIAKDLDLLAGGRVPEAQKWFAHHAGEGDVLLLAGSHQVIAQVGQNV